MNVVSVPVFVSWWCTVFMINTCNVDHDELICNELVRTGYVIVCAKYSWSNWLMCKFLLLRKSVTLWGGVLRACSVDYTAPAQWRAYTALATSRLSVTMQLWHYVLSKSFHTVSKKTVELIVTKFASSHQGLGLILNPKAQMWRSYNWKLESVWVSIYSCSVNPL